MRARLVEEAAEMIHLLLERRENAGFQMSRASPQMRNLAKRIIACETDGDSSAGAKMPDAFHVFEKLRPQLVPLMGKGGFRALISRALREARVEAPWLRAIQVKTNGNLAGLKEIQALLSLDAIYVGRVALLAQVLGQLVAFIGENLMSRMVLRVWPQAA